MRTLLNYFTKTSSPITIKSPKRSSNGNKDSPKEKKKERKKIDNNDKNNIEIKLTVEKMPLLSAENETHLSDYELVRQQKIERNKKRLEELGLLNQQPLHSTNNKPFTKNKPTVIRQKKRKRVPDGDSKTLSHNDVGLRRSTRNKKGSEKNVEKNNESTELHSSTKFIDDSHSDNPEEKVEELFEDSPLCSIYDISRQSSTLPNIKSSQTMKSFNPSDGFQQLGPDLITGHKNSMFYSLDYSPESKLICAAGKSGMINIWNHNYSTQSQINNENEDIYPKLSWKAHGGRWISDVRFLQLKNNDRNNNIISAANDGSVCLWDTSKTSCQTGIPKLICNTGKSLHSSGIFSMDVFGELVCTASKDKTFRVTNLESICNKQIIQSTYISHNHTSKVSCVAMRNENMIGSTDDTTVQIHDIRSPDTITTINDAHSRPHSIVWHPTQEHNFVTAGLDDFIPMWDTRKLEKPVSYFRGHALKTKKYKKIFRPAFYNSNVGADNNKVYLLTGSEGSECLSVFLCPSDETSTRDEDKNDVTIPVISRGHLSSTMGHDISCMKECNNNCMIVGVGGSIQVLTPK